MNEFEQKLQRQSLRQVPEEWREEILAAAGRAQVAPRVEGTSRSLLSTFRKQFSTLLWPNPLAWGGLAVAWIFIFALHVASSDHSPALAKKVSSPSPEVIAELREQQRLFAELLGPRDERIADRSKVHAPRPRSQCVRIVFV